MWAIARQPPLSMEFFRQEYWSGHPHPSTPEDHPDPGIEPKSPVSPPLADGFFTTAPPGRPQQIVYMSQIFSITDFIVSTFDNVD